MKIRPLGTESFNADRRKDGRTDRSTYMTKLIISFRSFTEAPNKLTDLSDLVFPPPASSLSQLDFVFSEFTQRTNCSQSCHHCYSQ